MRDIFQSFITLSHETGDMIVSSHRNDVMEKFYNFTNAQSAHEKMQVARIKNALSHLFHRLRQHLSPILAFDSIIRVRVVKEEINIGIEGIELGLRQKPSFKSFHSAEQIVEWLEKILIFYRHFPEKGQMHAWRFHTSTINCYASTPARVFLKRAAIISPDIPSDIALLDRFLDKTLHDSSSISRFCDASSHQGLFFVPEGRDIVRHLAQRTAQ